MYCLASLKGDRTDLGALEHSFEKALSAYLEECVPNIAIAYNKRDMTVGEISGQFSMSKPAITKHLDILKNAELVTSEKKGVHVIYSINLTVLQEVLSGFLSYFEQNVERKCVDGRHRDGGREILD